MEHVWKIYVAAWFCAMIAACVGTYFTKSAWCMWIMVLPAVLSFSENKSGDKQSGGRETRPLKFLLKNILTWTSFYDIIKTVVRLPKK